ncbi:DUF2721 domain-containing protein [Methylocystis sp. SC2]|uniref:DUF2721 domain-containing protein n=1 Tax=Methylocystis sp. (strain SC2) TaxID=187303 RepID=UPI00027AEB6B|nr:DUF2721 domain-containing protein [Methylocystis sp. SC2]CCJ06263.1 Conserved hypothetical protein [Methylocystis sp. SC2]
MIFIFDPPSIEQLSNVISQVTGPAFLLAAEAQLLSVLVSRLDRIVDRSRIIAQGGDDKEAHAHLKAELPILKQRGMLMHYAIYWGVASCIVTSVLVIVSFGAAYLHMRHEYGAGLLFAVAMALFTAALIAFARELQLGYLEIGIGAKPPQTPARKSYPHV